MHLTVKGLLISNCIAWLICKRYLDWWLAFGRSLSFCSIESSAVSFILSWEEHRQKWRKGSKWRLMMRSTSQSWAIYFLKLESQEISTSYICIICTEVLIKPWAFRICFHIRIKLLGIEHNSRRATLNNIRAFRLLFPSQFLPCVPHFHIERCKQFFAHAEVLLMIFLEGLCETWLTSFQFCFNLPTMRKLMMMLFTLHCTVCYHFITELLSWHMFTWNRRWCRFPINFVIIQGSSDRREKNPWSEWFCLQTCFVHEFNETCHSVTFYFMKRDSERCCDTTTPQ